MSVFFDRVGFKATRPAATAAESFSSLMSTTKGSFMDFTVNDNLLWEDASGTVAATSGSLVQTADPKIIGTTNMRYGTTFPATEPPTWTSAQYLTFNGDDQFRIPSSNGGGLNAMFRNVGSGVCGARFRPTSLAAARGVVKWSRNSDATAMFGFQISTAGAVTVDVRRLNGDSITSVSSTTGLVTTNTDYTFIATVDWTNGGTGAIKGYLDGSEVLSGDLTGTGNTSDLNHSSVNIGSYGGVTWFIGRIYRTMGANFLPTSEELTTIKNALEGTYT